MAVYTYTNLHNIPIHNEAVMPKGAVVMPSLPNCRLAVSCCGEFFFPEENAKDLKNLLTNWGPLLVRKVKVFNMA